MSSAATSGAQKLAGKKRLSIFANRALTSIPFGVLVRSGPQGKQLKDQDWLIKSYSVTSLPSIYSLKTMRAQTATVKSLVVSYWDVSEDATAKLMSNLFEI